MEDELAHYLIAKKQDDIWHVLTEVSAESLRQAIEGIKLKDGESVKVYRIASAPKTVTLKEEVVRKLEVD